MPDPHSKSFADQVDQQLLAILEEVREIERQEHPPALERAPQVGFRAVSQTEASRLPIEYWLLERKRRRKLAEKAEMAKLYKRLQAEIAAEIQQIEIDQERLDRGAFYRVIEVPVEGGEPVDKFSDNP